MSFAQKILQPALKRQMAVGNDVSTAAVATKSFLALLVYGAAFAEAALLDAPLLALPASILTGLMSAYLFRQAHDAAHGSLTADRRVNAILGRLFIAPSLHAFAAWDLFHNRRHHPFNNLSVKDYIWIPLSLEQYRRLRPAVRAFQRVTRTPLGSGLGYLVAVWWRFMVWPEAAAMRQATRRDSAIAAGFLLVQCGLAAALAGADAGAGRLLQAIGFAVLLPFLLLCHLLGYVSFLNHTHPDLPWFDDPAEWRRHRTRHLLAVHYRVPWWLFLLRTDLAHHATHHLAPRLTIEHLPRAEQRMMPALRQRAVVEDWSPRRQREIFARCKLYDFRRHLWIGFDGAVTARPVLTGRSAGDIPQCSMREPSHPSPVGSAARIEARELDGTPF